MMGAFRFETGAATHVGRVRSVNEDRFVARPEIGLWAVADGMGGLGSGDVASGAIADHLARMGHPTSAPDLLRQFEQEIILVNTRLRHHAAEHGLGVIGSTIAALLVYDRHYAAVWSGDSRIYRLRGGTLAQLSRDHTEAQELVDSRIIAPEEARHWPRRNVVTRAIGVEDEAELAFEHGAVAAGDRFLLCSDGLTGHVEDQEIRDALIGANPQRICDLLVEMTLARGASDNVTAVVIHCAAAAVEQTVRLGSSHPPG